MFWEINQNPLPFSDAVYAIHSKFPRLLECLWNFLKTLLYLKKKKESFEQGIIYLGF